MTTATGMPWRAVMALAVSQLVAWGILYYAFAVIQAPMGRELGWTLPQRNGAFSLALCISGLSAYHVGRHIDRQGGRRVMFAGALIAALALCGWSQVVALWQFYLVMIVIGIAAAMTLYEAAFAVVARLAPHDYRRGITTITVLGGLASTCFIPLTYHLVEQVGWRSALLVYAGIIILVCAAIPLLVLSPALRETSIRPETTNNARVFDAVKRMPEVLLEALSAASLKLDDVDLFLFHQANLRINEFVMEQLSIPPERCSNNIQRYGNCSSASIPMLLDEAARGGRLQSGQLVSMTSFGSGFSWASAVLRW